MFGLKVESLKPFQKKVNITVKAVSVTEPREVTSRLDGSQHKVAEALVGDETACILLTLWDEDIDKIIAGETYDIENAFTTLFKNSMRLNIGRYGTLKKSSQSIETVNTSNNLSEKKF